MGLFNRKKRKLEEAQMIANSDCVFRIERILYPNIKINGQRVADIGGRLLKGRICLGDEMIAFERPFKILKIQKGLDILPCIDTNDYVGLAVAYEPISYYKLPFKKGVYRIVSGQGAPPQTPAQATEKNYTFYFSGFSEDENWIYLECREEDSLYEQEPFAELAKQIAQKWNNGKWEGMISSVGPMRYRVKNDPLNLVYQWDDLFGIVVEYSKNTPEEVRAFLFENYGIK